MLKGPNHTKSAMRYRDPKHMMCLLVCDTVQGGLIVETKVASVYDVVGASLFRKFVQRS